MKRSMISIGMGAMALLGTVLNSSADTITYDYNNAYSGTSPAGIPPWLEATFSDSGLPANTVQLTLSAVNLSPSESVTCWYFNINPTLDPTALQFNSSALNGSFDMPSILTGVDSFKAGGDGKYDVLFTFGKSGGASSLFGDGDSVTFTITGIAGLSADDFNFLSAPGGGSGPYASAAHIVSGDQNGWVDPASVLHPSAFANDAVTVPDVSATISLLGLSMFSLGIFRKFGKRYYC